MDTTAGAFFSLIRSTVLRTSNTGAFFGGGAVGHIQSCSSAGTGGGLTYLGQTNSSTPGSIPAPSVMFVAGVHVYVCPPVAFS